MVVYIQGFPHRVHRRKITKAGFQNQINSCFQCSVLGTSSALQKCATVRLLLRLNGTWFELESLQLWLLRAAIALMANLGWLSEWQGQVGDIRSRGIRTLPRSLFISAVALLTLRLSLDLHVTTLCPPPPTPGASSRLWRRLQPTESGSNETCVAMCARRGWRLSPFSK